MPCRVADAGFPSEEPIRLQALETVEQAGTPKARDLLKELANGDADDPVTQGAKAAVKRMERRAVP